MRGEQREGAVVHGGREEERGIRRNVTVGDREVEMWKGDVAGGCGREMW